MRSVDDMKLNIKTITYVVMLGLIIIWATWSLLRGAINIYFYLFFLAGCVTFIVWNLSTRMKFIKKNIDDTLRAAEDAMKIEEWNIAINYFDELLKANPNFTKALVGKAHCYKKMAGYRDAIPHVKRAIESDPDCPDAHFLMGICYFEGRYTDEAIDCFDKTLSLKPDYGEAYTYLGDLYKLRKNYDEAARNYEKYLELGKDSQKLKHAREMLKKVKD